MPYARRRDGLGTTHHESGTLWMGDDPATSVTRADGRFHNVENAYVIGPALCPLVGSVNPMLTGVALARRMADTVTRAPVAPALERGFQALFDGVHMDAWDMTGGGRFIVVDGALESVPGSEIGLLWYRQPVPENYVLRLEWLRYRDDDNSGVFFRFPNPLARDYNNPAYVAVQFGFEVQIDELARPDGNPIHRTGAIYGITDQSLTPHPAKPLGQWNEYEIRVQGQTYTVVLNGEQVTQYQNADARRGSTAEPTFIGLQSYPGSRVAFRNIRIKGG